MTSLVYLDNASTTKPSEEVLSEMNRIQNSYYGNPSSKHNYGVEIREFIDKARQQVAQLLNCNESEIYFNSGSTEGINTALRGYVEANIEKGQHIITTKVEHKAVLEVCKYLENIGIDITYLDVDKDGLIDLDQLQSSIRRDTLLISILWVNNETGVIQDIEKIARIVSDYDVKFFVDATQGIGKLNIDLSEVKIDMLCLSAHKFHGPKGVGALFIRDGVKISPLLHGGGQENGFRSGTTNTSGIIGLGIACKDADINNSRIIKLQQYFENSLKDRFDCKIIGESVNRSNYISNVIIKNIDADIVIAKLRRTMVSSGSACTSRIVEPSHVLKNMGYPDEDCFSSLRFSYSKYTTLEEVDVAINELVSVI